MSQSIGSSIGYSRKRLKRLKRPSLGLKRPILITDILVENANFHPTSIYTIIYNPFEFFVQNFNRNCMPKAIIQTVQK